MVSVRDQQSQAQAHLGLGLYIVRLIAGFHGGVAMATNLDDGSGVEVSVEFPLDENAASQKA
jgi:K+-sensing histidine kinase KdpD